jgi:DnaJ-class molecular chaperone
MKPRKLKPVTGIRCNSCKGTGAKDGKRRADGTWIRCWACNGNGLDPAEYFNWKKPK